MEVYPENMDGTKHHIMRYAHDAVYHPFFRGIHVPPSTEKLLQSFLIYFLNFYKE